MRILSIETSCDETAIAVLEFQKGRKKSGSFVPPFAEPKFKILSNTVSSQIKIHAPYGGVVPNLAKREHQKNLVPILKQTLKESGMLKKIKNQKSKIKIIIKNSKLFKILEREQELLKQTLKFLEKYKKPKIDLIAVTNGPGLEPALWVGINFAKALSLIWDIPLIAVNHLGGHIYSVLLKENGENPKSKIQNLKQIQNSKNNPALAGQKIKFPAMALIVSGGHTELILIKKPLNYKIVGETLDDATGEAFDKAARILSLGYPGGPAVAAKAAKSSISNFQFLNKFKIKLPRPMLNSKDFNFSFSGLKTAILYLVQGLKKSKKWSEKLTPCVAREFQEAVIEVLVKKSLKAMEKYSAKTFILCGGVSANTKLRHRLSDSLYKKYGNNFNFLMPDLEFSGDNAAMIALAAYFESQKNPPKPNNLKRIKANGNLNF